MDISLIQNLMTHLFVIHFNTILLLRLGLPNVLNPSDLLTTFLYAFLSSIFSVSYHRKNERFEVLTAVP
jgi:hypothetical protein